MAKWFSRLILFLGGIAAQRLKARSSDFIRLEIAKVYLKGIRFARESLIGLLLLVMGVLLFNAGLAMLVIGLFIILPWSLEIKAVILMVMGIMALGIPAVAFAAFFNEKTWLNYFKAEEVIKKITHHDLSLHSMEENPSAVRGLAHSESRAA